MLHTIVLMVLSAIYLDLLCTAKLFHYVCHDFAFILVYLNCVEVLYSAFGGLLANSALIIVTWYSSSLPMPTQSTGLLILIVIIATPSRASTHVQIKPCIKQHINRSEKKKIWLEALHQQWQFPPSPQVLLTISLRFSLWLSVARVYTFETHPSVMMQTIAMMASRCQCISSTKYVMFD